MQRCISVSSLKFKFKVLPLYILAGPIQWHSLHCNHTPKPPFCIENRQHTLGVSNPGPLQHHTTTITTMPPPLLLKNIWNFYCLTQLSEKKSSSSNNNQTKDIKPSNSYQPTRRNVYLSFDTKFNPSHTPTPIKNRHFSNISTQDTTRHQPLLGEKPRELFESFRFFPYISSLQ